MPVPFLNLSLPPTIFEREIRSGQTLRYEVSSKWSSPDGTASYQYEMRVTVDKFGKEKPEEIKAFARVFNLDAQFGDVQSPRVKLGAVLGMVLKKSGGPVGLPVVGNVATFSLPLLGWCLGQPSGKERTYPVKTTLESGVAVDGSAKMTRLASRLMTIEHSMAIGPEEGNVRYAGTTVFRLGSGEVLSSEGRVTDSRGTLSFQIKKI